MNSHWPSFCILAAGIFLRFIYLDSDPQYDAWIGYITDEGRWIEHARSLSLHGKMLEQDMLLHFYLAPVYQLANYLVFLLAGVSFFTSRLLSALCGSALLIIFWARLRHLVSPRALFLGLTLLAFQPDILALSRVAVPEMATILMQLVIYFQIVKMKQSAWRITIAGCLMLLTLGVKATTAALLPIYSLVIFLMPRCPDEVSPWRGLMLFWTGLLLPVALAGSVAVVYAPEKIALLISRLGALWDNILIDFIHLSSLYEIISYPFANSLPPTFNLLLFGIWLSVAAWIAADRKSTDFESHRYLVTAATWFSLYFALILLSDYFPARYQIHIIIPAAIFIAVGISLLQRLGLPAVMKKFGKSDGAAGVLVLSFLCLPTAVVLSPLAASAAGFFAADPERIRIKLACILFLLAGTTYFAIRTKRSQSAIVFLLVFPFLAGVAWVIISMLNDFSFWPRAGNQAHFASYGLLVSAVVGISIAVARILIHGNLLTAARMIALCVLFYVMISLARFGPGYTSPHYSMRDASHDLGKILSGNGTIATIKVEGLFNENDLRYKSIALVDWTVETPEIVVLAFRDVERMLRFKRNYQLMKSYKIFISPNYHHGTTDPVPYLTRGVTVSVYKKNGTGQE